MTARALLDELERRAAEEIAAARQCAHDDVATIRRDAKRADDQRAAAAHNALATAAMRTAAVACAEATRRMNARLLPARAAALDRVFARARERIELRVGHPGLADAVAAQVNDALTYLPGGAVRVTCAPKIAAAVRNALARTGRADATLVEDPSVPLGVVVESADGEIAVAATFAARMDRERASLAIEVARRLAPPTT